MHQAELRERDRELREASEQVARNLEAMLSKSAPRDPAPPVACDFEECEDAEDAEI